MKRGHIIGMLVLCAAVAAVQGVATATDREYYLVQATMAAYTTVVVMGLGLVMGYAGQVSLGHAAFFALGGYASGILTTTDISGFARGGLGSVLGRMGILVVRSRLFGQSDIITFSAGVAVVLALLLTAAVALGVGYPALRLRGHYLAMATLGFGLIVYRLVLGSEITGSADGISGVPPWHILPGLTLSGDREFRVANYYLAWALSLSTLVFILNVVESRVGRALRSIHGSEIAANSMGVNTSGYKLKAFVISAILAGAAGSCMTHYTGGVGPSEAGVMKSVRYVALVAAGGAGNVWGGLTVGFVLTFLSLRGCFGTLDDAVFGVVLIAIMTVAPQGPLRPLLANLKAAREWLLTIWVGIRAGRGIHGAA